MTTIQPRPCEDVLLAAQALLDGERPGVTSREIQAHTADCAGCRAAVADLAMVHAALGRMDYEALDVDLWSGIRQQIALERRRSAPPQGAAILGLSIVLIAWRVAQLLLDIPAPVINSVVPLAAVVVVLWRLAGDPFAVQLSLNQIQQIHRKARDESHEFGRRSRPALHVCHGGARDWPPQLRESVRLREIDPGDRARPEGASGEPVPALEVRRSWAKSGIAVGAARLRSS